MSNTIPPANLPIDASQTAIQGLSESQTHRADGLGNHSPYPWFSSDTVTNRTPIQALSSHDQARDVQTIANDVLKHIGS